MMTQNYKQRLWASSETWVTDCLSLHSIQLQHVLKNCTSIAGDAITCNQTLNDRYAIRFVYNIKPEEYNLAVYTYVPNDAATHLIKKLGADLLSQVNRKKIEADGTVAVWSPNSLNQHATLICPKRIILASHYLQIIHYTLFIIGQPSSVIGYIDGHPILISRACILT